jgi:hypothetical protein
MANKYCHFVLLMAVVALLTTVASANQVTLGNSTTGNVKFTNVQGDTTDVQVSFTGNCGEGGSNCVSGLGLYGTDEGSYKMWITGGTPLLTPPDSFAVYGVNLNAATVHFWMKLTTGGSGTLTGTVNLEQLSGGSTRVPEFLGDFTASTVSGAFLSSFAPGVTTPGDFSVFLPNTVNVDHVFGGKRGAYVQGPISSGELLPTPEPASLGLLGTGLLTMAGVIRRRLLV